MTLEIDDDFDIGWDIERYDCWWQDPDYRPDMLTKAEIAEVAEVSLKTIDDWIRRGAPVHCAGSNGIGYQINRAEFMEWRRARDMGLSIPQYREYQLEQVQKRKRAQRLCELEAENKQLKSECRALRIELKRLRKAGNLDVASGN